MSQTECNDLRNKVVDVSNDVIQEMNVSDEVMKTDVESMRMNDKDKVIKKTITRSGRIVRKSSYFQG